MREADDIAPMAAASAPRFLGRALTNNEGYP